MSDTNSTLDGGSVLLGIDGDREFLTVLEFSVLKKTEVPNPEHVTVLNLEDYKH